MQEGGISLELVEGCKVWRRMKKRLYWNLALENMILFYGMNKCGVGSLITEIYEM